MYALIGLTSAWLAGIACAAHLRLTPLQWLLVACGFASCALITRRQPRVRLLFLLGALFCLGGLRMLADRPSITPGSLAFYAGMQQPIVLTGIVAAFPEQGASATTLRLRVESLQAEGDSSPRTVSGLAVVQANRSIEWAYGDRLRARGRLRNPGAFGESRYAAYLARQGVDGWMPQASAQRLATRQGALPLQWLDDLRRSGLRSLHRLFPQPEAGLLAGILLGVESGISDEVMRAFTRTNTSHIIAISGFNIAIVSAMVIQVFGRMLGARRGALAAVIAIAGYTVLVGASASVVRAAWMAGLALLARWLGRTSEALLSLMASAWLMTLIHPATLFDVGFQLSFAATLGLILYGAPLQVRADGWIAQRLPPGWAQSVASPLAAMLVLTLAAQVTTLPLTVYYFQRLSLVSLLANAVVLPLQPALMILSGCAMLLGMVWLPAGQPVAWAAWLFPALTIRAVEFFSTWPGASIALEQISPGAVLLSYTLLLGITVLARRERPEAAAGSIRRAAQAAGPAAIAVCAILAWKTGVDRPDGRLSLTVLESERGQAALLTTPLGRSLLIGGGADPTRLREAVSRRLPLLERSLDWLIVGASDTDSLAGLQGISDHLSLQAALICGSRQSEPLRLLLAELTASGTEVQPAAAGQRFDLGTGARLEVLAVSEHGCLLLLEHGRARFLLAPGIDPEAVQSAIRSWSRPGMTAYVAADGGHPAVNPAEWLTALSPRLVILSGDTLGAAGNPAIQSLEAAGGARLLDTLSAGWVQLETDGETLWISTQRRVP
jgi:competence protein ComEC